MQALQQHRPNRREPASPPRCPFAAALLAAALLLLAAGCNRYAARPEPRPEASAQEIANDGEHEHRTGQLGGVIASLGRDEYHAEAVFEAEGRLALYTLGSDETRIQEVQQQVLTAYVKPQGSNQSLVMVLQPDPLPDDPPGMTSRFAGTLPEEMRGPRLYITVPGLRIAGERFTLRLQSPEAAMEPAMPVALDDGSASDLYLTPGGLYTQADIEANGRQTAGQKYAGFKAKHDFQPQPGDPLCPVTRTKANPQCTWVIGGQPYQFCCPPCIDEFLALAKQQPDQILPPDGYTKQP